MHSLQNNATNIKQYHLAYKAGTNSYKYNKNISLYKLYFLALQSGKPQTNINITKETFLATKKRYLLAIKRNLQQT